LAHPFGLAYFEDHLYIANMGSDTMMKVSKFNGWSRLIAHRGNVKSEHMRIYHAVMQPMINNSCNGSSCDHLCLLRQEGHSCSCSDGYGISIDGSTCEPDPDAESFGKNAAITGQAGTPLLTQSPPMHGSRIFTFTLTILGLLCLILILAMFANYYFAGPVTMESLRNFSPSRLRDSKPFRNIVISFRNPIFKKGDQSLIDNEEADGYDSGPEDDQSIPEDKKNNNNNDKGPSMVRNMSCQSAMSDYQTAVFEPLPEARYDPETQTFTINVSSPCDETKLLP
jgi:hypothetical protein